MGQECGFDRNLGAWCIRGSAGSPQNSDTEEALPATLSFSRGSLRLSLCHQHGSCGDGEALAMSGCFACSPLPYMSEHPCSPASCGGNTGVESLAEDASWRTHPCKQPCWMVAWHRLPPGALDKHCRGFGPTSTNTQATVRARANASPALLISAVGCACLTAELAGTINSCFSP